MKDAQRNATLAGKAAPQGVMNTGGGTMIPPCNNTLRHFRFYTHSQVNTGHLTHEGWLSLLNWGNDLLKSCSGRKRKIRIIIARNEQFGIFPMEIYFLLSCFGSWVIIITVINFGLKWTVFPKQWKKVEVSKDAIPMASLIMYFW